MFSNQAIDALAIAPANTPVNEDTHINSLTPAKAKAIVTTYKIGIAPINAPMNVPARAPMNVPARAPMNVPARANAPPVTAPMTALAITAITAIANATGNVPEKATVNAIAPASIIKQKARNLKPKREIAAKIVMVNNT
jgi:hypothetical protein